jgi:hypothetical protein
MLQLYCSLRNEIISKITGMKHKSKKRTAEHQTTNYTSCFNIRPLIPALILVIIYDNDHSIVVLRVVVRQG